MILRRSITVSAINIKAEKRFSTLVNKKTKSAPNHHIIMVSGRSCDTGDWSNDAENSACHHRNKWHFIMY